MSNEELAVRIKAGERDRLLELWEQVRGLIALCAVRRCNTAPCLGGCEVEDLIQSGYIAMVAAIDDFDPEAGYKFTTYLRLHLKKAFAEAGGYRSEKQKLDPLLRCDSLDRPIGDDDGDTLGDIQAAPDDGLEAVEQRIWLEQLHAALDRAMKVLPDEWRDTLEQRYYCGRSQRAVAERMQVRKSDVRKWERKAIGRLYHDRRLNGLDQFWVEAAVDLKTPWYLHVGPVAFVSTGTSAVEKIVLQRERDREHQGRLTEYIDAINDRLKRDRKELEQAQIFQR